MTIAKRLNKCKQLCQINNKCIYFENDDKMHSHGFLRVLQKSTTSTTTTTSIQTTYNNNHTNVSRIHTNEMINNKTYSDTHTHTYTLNHCLSHTHTIHTYAMQKSEKVTHDH